MPGPGQEAASIATIIINNASTVTEPSGAIRQRGRDLCMLCRGDRLLEGISLHERKVAVGPHRQQYEKCSVRMHKGSTFSQSGPGCHFFGK